MKVVINTCFGGFSLSAVAVARLKALGHATADHGFSYSHVERDHPDLVQLVEELGHAAAGDCSKLKIVEVPDDVDWEIDEYDGLERVVESHRSWQ